MQNTIIHELLCQYCDCICDENTKVISYRLKITPRLNTYTKRDDGWYQGTKKVDIDRVNNVTS